MDIPNVIIVSDSPHCIPDVDLGRALACKSPHTPTMRLIEDELAIHYFNDISFSFSDEELKLQHWVDQGVMLLNCVLTTDPYCNEPYVDLYKNGTHSFYWRKTLMEDFFTYMSDTYEDLIFVFLGQKALYYDSYIDPRKHTTFSTVDPIPDYRVGKELFLGSKIFNKINTALTQYKKTPIQWASKYP